MPWLNKTLFKVKMSLVGNGDYATCDGIKPRVQGRYSYTKFGSMIHNLERRSRRVVKTGMK